MSIILYKYHNAILGPLLQTCKCRVQSTSTVIYGLIFIPANAVNIF